MSDLLRNILDDGGSDQFVLLLSSSTVDDMMDWRHCSNLVLAFNKVKKIDVLISSGTSRFYKKVKRM